MRLATASLCLLMLLIAANVSWPAAPQEAGPTVPSENSTQPRIKSQVAPKSIERRLVPAGQPADWPREPNVRYLPMAADEFERRLLQIHDNQAETGNASPAAFLSRAEYRAELRDDNSLRGEANWEFTLQSSKRAFARLNDCQLALGDYRWLTGPGATDQKTSGEDERAIVGNDEGGRLYAVVDRSGKMACGWSLSAMHDTTGASSFALTLPACPLNTLQLSLPSALSPVVDHGIVTLQGKESGGKRNWRIELGGNNRTTLRIINTETAEHRTTTTLVRHSFAYEITPRGLEILADIKLDVLGAPLRQFRIAADAPLTVVMARMGENELSLGKVKPSAAKPPAEGVNAPDNEYLIDLPEPVQGAGRLLRIAAIAPFSWDSLWRLPVLHFPDAIWQEGTAKLIVAKPIVLDELQLKNCRQMEVEQLTGSAPGESLGIQFFEEDPEILVSASHQQPIVHVNQGARIELRANEGTAQVDADVSAVEGETFVLEADIAGQWLIDNVVSLPAGLVADWSQQPPRGRSGKLTVRLRSPLTRQQNVHLVINARRRRAPASDNFHASDLSMLKFNDTTTIRRLIHVQALEPFQLQLSGDDDLHRLDPAKLTPADQALLDAKGSGIVFVDDENAQLVSVTLATKAPQFDAEIHSQVLATDNRLIESYRFTITPSGRELRRFQIRFSQPRPEPIVWSIAGDPQALLSVKRVVSGESTTAEAGETWEAVLPTPMSAPFVLVATRETTLADDTPVALASLVDAENQRGTVQVSSNSRVPPEVRSRRRLNSIPIALPSADQYPTAIAAFQYNPTEQSALSSDPPLVLTALRGSKVLPQAWIWRADLQSNYGRDGAEHALTCRIENAGLSRIRFQPPDGARLRSVSIDGRETADSSVAAQDQWRIRLPTGDRYVTLVLRWNDDNGLRHTVSQFTTPWPTPDVPVLAGTWMVSSPPGTAIAESDSAGPIGSEVAWTKRLFGPLMRADDTSPNSAESAHRHTGKSQESPAVSAPGANRLAPLIQWSTTREALALSPPVGWTAYQMSNLGEQAQISIVDQPSMYAKAWALFVMTLALRWWIGRKSVAFDLVIFGSATCFAMLVPASWIPLTSAIWLGVCTGDLLVWTAETWNHRQNAEPHISTDRSSTAKLPVATIGGCIIILAAWHAYVSADEPRAGISASTVENSSKSHVLIPVDENNRPTGGTDYLPESLYEVLLRDLESKNSQDPSWLLVTAYYRAEIQNNAAAGGFSSSNWECTYNFESFVDRAAIRLPLGSNGAALVPDGVELDGKPQPFRWDDAQSRLEIVAVGAGTHRLTVKLHPLVDRGGCSFTVPSVAATRVELAIPRSTSIEIPSGITIGRTPSSLPSTSSPQIDSDMDRLISELGPVGRIVVSEASAAARIIPTAATLDVDELYWLRIRPGSVAVDARWKVNVRSGRVQQLRVTADPRWRPLPPAEGSAISQIHPASNDPNILVIELARPIVGRATIDASFLLVGASGIGNWRQPPFSLLDANASRRRYAVTIDNSLEFQASNIGTSTIRPEQFTAIWGAGDAAPKLAWRASEQSAGVVIKTRPRDSKLKSRYQLSLIAGLKDIEIGWLAEVAVADGPAFSYSVRIPPELEIETISVRDGTAMRNARWARSRPDLITVFLESPVVGARQIFLLGRMPTPPGGRIALPEFQVEGSEAGGFTALLLRRPEVRLDVLGTGGASRMSSSDAASLLNDAAERELFGSTALTNDRLVTALDSPSGSPSASLRVLPNQPKLAVVQVTTMNRTADVWAANVELDCQLTDGLLDSLRLDLPPNWSGPFTVSPAIPVAIDEVTGENRRQLVLRPGTPWGSGKMPTRFRVRISGPVAVAAGERPTAPDVRIHGHADQTAYVLLPRQTENQQLSWDTVGLVFRPLPGDMAERIPDLNLYRTYQVTGQQSRASLRSVERNSGNPQVRQEDIAYRWQPGGRSVCVANFDLVSAGVSNCILELPGDSQLVQARLDLVPAQVSTAGPNRWSVWMGDNKLPRRLEVIFITQVSAGTDRGRNFEAPRLVDWPVEKTLWTVIAPGEAGTGSISNGTPISALRYARSRFEGIAAIFDPAADSSLDKASADIGDWYTLWGRRFTAVRTALINLKSQATAEDQARAINADIATIDEQHARLMRRMGINATEGDAATLGSQPPDGIDQLVFAESPPDTVNHASVRGVGGPLAIEYSQQIRSTAIGRFILAACIGLLAIGAVIVGHRKAWSIRPAAFRPELAGVAVGLVWWLWLWPSLFGLAILCASLCMMLARRRMQKRAVRQGGAKTVSASEIAAAKSSFE